MESTAQWQSPGSFGDDAALLAEHSTTWREESPAANREADPPAPEETLGDGSPSDLPPAYYDDQPPTLPPPGDPHWREWPDGAAHEPSPRWIVYVIAGFLITTCLVHILFIFLLVH